MCIIQIIHRNCIGNTDILDIILLNPQKDPVRETVILKTKKMKAHIRGI